MSRVVFVILGLLLLASPANADQQVRATWYGNELRGHRTASGEAFNPDGLTAAHRSLPLGTCLVVGSRAVHRRSVAGLVVGRGAGNRHALDRKRDDEALLVSLPGRVCCGQVVSRPRQSLLAARLGLFLVSGCPIRHGESIGGSRGKSGPSLTDPSFCNPSRFFRTLGAKRSGKWTGSVGGITHLASQPHCEVNVTNKFVGLSPSPCCNGLYNRRCSVCALAVKGRGRYAQGCSPHHSRHRFGLRYSALPGISASAAESAEVCGGVRSVVTMQA